MLKNKVIAVVGGSGFIGRYVVQGLAREGALVKVGVRHPDEGLFLKTQGEVGQIKLEFCNIRDDGCVGGLVDHCDIVINLVGILHEKGRQSFAATQAQGAERVAHLSKDAGVKRYIQMSAIGADKDSDSEYARTKAMGEELVRQHFPQANIIRPSLVFGPEDKFFNKFAQMALLSPALPIFGDGSTKFQPVYVHDVAQAILKLASGRMAAKTYELGGPKVYTYKELMELILKTIGRKRMLAPVPMSVGKVMGSIAQMLPTPPVTRDQMKLLGRDNVVSKDALQLKDLGIEPASLEAILPTYLSRFAKQG